MMDEEATPHSQQVTVRKEREDSPGCTVSRLGNYFYYYCYTPEETVEVAWEENE